MLRVCQLQRYDLQIGAIVYSDARMALTRFLYFQVQKDLLIYITAGYLSSVGR